MPFYRRLGCARLATHAATPLRFGFNSVGTAVAKAQWAATAGFAGVVVWELGQDAHPQEAKGGLLLGALAEAAKTSAVSWVPGQEDKARLLAGVADEMPLNGLRHQEL